jgi:hypothetical protein
LGQCRVANSNSKENNENSVHNVGFWVPQSH